MFDSPRFRSAALVCLAAFMITACGKKDEPAGELAVAGGVLTYVPADTPYLLASGAPLPDDVLDKIEPATDRMLSAYQTVVRETLREAYEEDLMYSEDEEELAEAEKVKAVMDEFVSLMSIDALHDAGITRESRFAVYGNGLLPVIRFEVSDAAPFEAAIARIEQAAGASMDVAEIDGNSYRYLGDDDGRIVVGLFGNHAVMTMAPAGFGDAELKQLLGLTLPQRSIVDSGRLTDIVREYAFTNHYVGFFDTMRIASTFLGEASGLDKLMLDSAEFDASSLSDTCREEIREVAGIAPLVVLGYDEVSTEAVGGKVILRLRDDLATAMTGFAAVVPGLGIDSGGLGSFGMSFDLLAMRNFYEAKLDAMDMDPYVCEHLQEMQAGFAEGRSALQQPMPPMAYGFRGMNIIIDDAEDLDLNSSTPPEDIDATVLIAMDDAPSLVAMGAMFSPELAALEIQADGKPVALDLQQLNMVADNAYAAMTDSAIAIAVGDGADDRAAGALKADSVSPPLSMGVTMNAKTYYQLMAKSMSDQAADGGDLNPEARAAMTDALTATSELYDRMTFGMRFTEQGLVIESRATFAD